MHARCCVDVQVRGHPAFSCFCLRRGRCIAMCRQLGLAPCKQGHVRFVAANIVANRVSGLRAVDLQLLTAVVACTGCKKVHRPQFTLRRYASNATTTWHCRGLHRRAHSVAMTRAILPLERWDWKTPRHWTRCGKPRAALRAVSSQ